jgi:hypothetical protein
LGDLHVAHGHVDVFVAEQVHQSRKTDAQAEHFGSRSKILVRASRN